MRADGLTGPGGAFLVRRPVADREHEIEPGRIGPLPLVFRDGLRAQERDVVSLLPENLQRERVQPGIGFRARGMSLEPIAGLCAEDRFGEDRAGGISGADEQYLVSRLGHGLESYG